MIALDDDTTIGDAFARAAQTYGPRPFLAVPAGAHRSYHQNGFEIGFAEIGFRKQFIAPCPENRLHLTRGFEICAGLVERRGSVGLMFARIGTR